MNSSSKEQRVSSENDGRDRLSELPDEILVHILSFLPIVDAVRTVLIRRFGELWTLIPSLIFNCLEFADAKNWPGSRYQYDALSANFVRNALIIHKKTPIDKFELDLCGFVNADFFESFASEFTTWIRFALDREVNDLTVRVDYDTEDGVSILPRRVFTSQFVVTLHLECCRIGELSQVHMASLRKLSLTAVLVSDEVFEKIISGSPSLRELALESVVGLNKLHFTAPNIENLKLASYYGLLDCPNLKVLDVSCDNYLSSSKEKFVQVVDVSSILEVNINYCCNKVFYEYMKMFYDVNLFKFSDKAFQASKFKKRGLPQTRWKRLHIKTLLCNDQFPGICRILKCSPRLEELVVCKGSRDEWLRSEKFGTNVLSQEPPPCSMRQLKTVTMFGYTVPCHDLLQLAKYLLKSSVNLEKMVIFPCKNKCDPGNELKFVKQLLSFPRASADARVIIGSEVY